MKPWLEAFLFESYLPGFFQPPPPIPCGNDRASQDFEKRSKLRWTRDSWPIVVNWTCVVSRLIRSRSQAKIQLCLHWWIGHGNVKKKVTNWRNHTYPILLILLRLDRLLLNDICQCHTYITQFQNIWLVMSRQRINLYATRTLLIDDFAFFVSFP